MKKILKLSAFIALAIIFNACKNEDVKPVITSTTGNYKIAILSECPTG